MKHEAGINIGHAFVETTLINGTCSVNQLEFRYPVRLLLVKPDSKSKQFAAVYIVSFGGGLVSGDRVYNAIRVGRNCCFALFTQSFTKVFKSLSPDVCVHQDLDAVVEPESTFLHLPDPVVGFARSRYVQTQTYHLQDLRTSQLALLDWVSHGRPHMGENWSMDLYLSSNCVTYTDKVTLSQKTLFSDTVKLHGPEKLQRLAPFQCYGMLLLLGRSGLVLAWINYLRALDKSNIINPYSQSAQSCSNKTLQPLVWSISGIDHPSSPVFTNQESSGEQLGILVRFAAVNTNHASTFLKYVFNSCSNASIDDQNLSRAFLSAWPQCNLA